MGSHKDSIKEKIKKHKKFIKDINSPLAIAREKKKLSDIRKNMCAREAKDIYSCLTGRNIKGRKTRLEIESNKRRSKSPRAIVKDVDAFNAKNGV